MKTSLKQNSIYSNTATKKKLWLMIVL